MMPIRNPEMGGTLPKVDIAKGAVYHVPDPDKPALFPRDTNVGRTRSRLWGTAREMEEWSKDIGQGRYPSKAPKSIFYKHVPGQANGFDHQRFPPTDPRSPLYRAKKKALESKAKLIEFNEQSRESGNLWGAASGLPTAYRKARRMVPWARRIGDVAEDTSEVASGGKPQNPFWKKSWFKGAATAAVPMAAIYGARKVNQWHLQDAIYPNSLPFIDRKRGNLKEKVVRVARAVDYKLNKKIGRKIFTDSTPFFSAVDAVKYLAAKRRGLVQFDIDASIAGWDVRDPRGRSARVYAPGSRRRERREKSWDERTENIRAMRNAAAVLAVAGLGGTGYFHNRSVKNARELKRQYRQKIAARGGPRMPPKTDGVVIEPDKRVFKTFSSRAELIQFAKQEKESNAFRNSLIAGSGFAIPMIAWDAAKTHKIQSVAKQQMALHTNSLKQQVSNLGSDISSRLDRITPSAIGAAKAVHRAADVVGKTSTTARRLFLAPRLAARKVKSLFGFSSRAELIEFAKQEKESRTKKALRFGGATLAAGGAAALPAAIPMLKIQGRRMNPRTKNDPISGGRFVSDYLNSAQRALNSGPQGVLAGKIIQYRRSRTKAGSLDRFMADHYARFRSGPREALRHWDYEVGESLYQSASRKGLKPEQIKARMEGFNKSREKVHAAIDQQLWNHGKNETEAIRSVAHTEDQDIQNHFRRLAAHKTEAVKRRYGPLSALSPASIAAGSGMYAIGRKKKEDRREFSSKDEVLVNRLIDATKDSVDRPEIPGEDFAKTIAENPKARSALARVILATTALTGGVGLGAVSKRPKTGLALGALTAGMTLK